MNDSARYAKIVEWSDKDNCFVGSCPGLLLGGVVLTLLREEQSDVPTGSTAESGGAVQLLITRSDDDYK